MSETKEKKSLFSSNRTDTIKVIVFISLSVVLLLVVLLVFLKMQKFDFESKSIGNIFNTLVSGRVQNADRKVCEISFDGKDPESFGKSGQFIVKCGKSSLIGYDLEGNIKWENPVTMNNPVVKFTGDFMVAADIGGKEIVVYQGKDKKWQNKVDTNILNVDINAAGYVTYVHDSSEYKSAVSVLDVKGSEFLTKGKGENFIINASLSPNSKQLIVNIVDTSNIYANTVFEFYDLEKLSDNAYASIKKENALFPSFWFLSDGATFAVSDKTILLLDASSKEKWEKQISGKIFSTSTVSGKFCVVAAASIAKGVDDSSKTDITIYGEDGIVHSVYKMDGEIKNMSTSESQIAINAGRELHFIDARGQLNFTYALKKDIVDVYFLYNDRAAVLTRDSLTVIRTSH